jgi:hypothetical protein
VRAIGYAQRFLLPKVIVLNRLSGIKGVGL